LDEEEEEEVGRNCTVLVVSSDVEARTPQERASGSGLAANTTLWLAVHRCYWCHCGYLSSGFVEGIPCTLATVCIFVLSQEYIMLYSSHDAMGIELTSQISLAVSTVSPPRVCV
jgi:hypothetical protein